MDKRKYYKDLFSLLEAPVDSEYAQDQIASEGSDVEDPNLKPEIEEVEDENNQEEETIDDANYLMNGENQMAQPPVDNSAILEVEKKEKLFDLFRNLLNYGELFLNSLQEIDVCLIDEKEAEKIEKNKKLNNDINEKIKTYILDYFNINTYEKSLYIYILLRTELLSVIKDIRTILDIENGIVK